MMLSGISSPAILLNISTVFSFMSLPPNPSKLKLMFMRSKFLTSLRANVMCCTRSIVVPGLSTCIFFLKVSTSVCVSVFQLVSVSETRVSYELTNPGRRHSPIGREGVERVLQHVITRSKWSSRNFASAPWIFSREGTARKIFWSPAFWDEEILHEYRTCVCELVPTVDVSACGLLCGSHKF